MLALKENAMIVQRLNEGDQIAILRHDLGQEIPEEFLLYPEGGASIASWARVEERIYLEDPNGLEGLDLSYKNDTKGMLLVLRVFLHPNPVEVPATKRTQGAWIDIKRRVDIEGSTPAVREDVFEEKAEEIIAAVII